MSVIYCYVDPFVMNQKIYLVNDMSPAGQELIAKTVLENLSYALTYYYYENNCEKMILSSTSKNLIDDIIFGVEVNAGLTAYKNKPKINIEVI